MVCKGAKVTDLEIFPVEISTDKVPTPLHIAGLMFQFSFPLSLFPCFLSHSYIVYFFCMAFGQIHGVLVFFIVMTLVHNRLACSFTSVFVVVVVLSPFPLFSQVLFFQVCPRLFILWFSWVWV